MKTIYFTVTNELVYDQRMIRICTTLARENYSIVLVGRRYRGAAHLQPHSFRQVRIFCWFTKGKLFYIEFNTRLLFYLFFKKMDGLCAIDLDTILPCWLVSRIKRIPRVYDAHELFCEMKEVRTRPLIYSFWKRVEQFAVPGFTSGYTVNLPIAKEFKRMYGVNYSVIRNIAALHKPEQQPEKTKTFLLYQGAVNEGRSFETLIPAMQYIHVPLVICGDGNFMPQVKILVKKHGVEDKVIFKGRIAPDELKKITPLATIGITLFDREGMSNYYSLANRFFDYIHAGIPQLCADYPAYREINEEFEVGLLITDLSAENIARHINTLLTDSALYEKLRQNCLAAKQVYNWQNEENKLIDFYRNLLH
ncbi:glycosyltransferase [Agriterribacter sp.]|uniref:glycosyltransferase n=1 Tax=Agriterribacter sp. TaxID=2821509 RepID=UPI002CC19725|nr:glycosyltransferase [Agriterribacter sp.]HRO46797.1 glycosyltransferase [Agriterribacter sp.]HRQ15594.1 glycosyltransferase [Agriterribacter sp.]